MPTINDEGWPAFIMVRLISLSLVVNGVNVRPFPARKVENRREPLESTSQTSIKWRKSAGDGTPFLVIQAISKKRI
jgi:hypothetical protein